MMGQHPDNMSEAERAQIKEFFIRERGYWRPWTDTMLQACPGFVEQYACYAGYPARTGPLSPRMVELIYVALDSSSSHLFASGLQTHMRRALEVGATQSDIFDVLHLVAVQGAASVCQAADILAECSGAHLGELQDEGLDARLNARIGELSEEHALSLRSVCAPWRAWILATWRCYLTWLKMVARPAVD